MRDTYFFLIGLAGFVGLWVVATIEIGRLGGWTLLAKRYQCGEPFAGPCWSFQSGNSVG